MDFDFSDPDLQNLQAPANVPIQGVGAGPYLTSAGATYSALAAIQQGKASATLMKQNAAIAGLQAQSESQVGAQQAELYRQHLNATLGKQAAAVSGSNVTMSGSPLRALQTTAILGAQDIDRVQANAARKAWGFEVQQAGDQYKAKEDSAGGWSQALGGLITTGARSYGQWSSDFG